MYYLFNLLLYLEVTIAAGVGQQGNWDKKSDISVWLGSRPAVGNTLTITKIVIGTRTSAAKQINHSHSKACVEKKITYAYFWHW